ncbi:MAG: hypothetical protein M3019_01245 [Candidatus Dormibacteraeota bacterium]|nr:hypothetical protein [Candidatus Dormibacteraeota bacterium]
MTARRRLALAGLAALVAGSGVLHLLVPQPYERIVPAPLLAWRSQLVAVSGGAEIVCAVLLVTPRTRRIGAYATALLFVVVFPANVQMALDGGVPGAGFPFNSGAVAWLRLPLQVPLIGWALAFRGRRSVATPKRQRVSASLSRPGRRS